MQYPASLSVCVAGLLFSTVTAAEVERDLDSHEHGASEFNIVIDGNALYLEFESPWANLIGFEHQPSTDEQRALLSEAMARLEDPLSLIVPDEGADCSVEATEVTSTLSTDEEHADEEHAHEDDHAHDKEHASDHDEDSKSDIHSEVVAAYTYSCADMDELASLTMQLLTVWPGIDDIDVQMAGPGGQSALELDKNQPVVDLSDIR